MTQQDDLIVELAAQVADLRAEVSALQQRLATAPTATATAMEHATAVDAAPRGTSRRSLLRGAAAATAAAAVATVAVGGVQQAHAAPEATGDTFTLGQGNDANATTTLTNTSGSLPNPLLLVSNGNGGNGGTAIEGDGDYIGVMGSAKGSGAGYGVYGLSDSGPGVFGASSSGAAVWGHSASGVGGLFMGSQAAISLGPGTTVGVPIAGQHGMGDIYLDAAATVWLCVGAGVPGTWVRLPGVASGALGGVINYLSKPLRLLDTRPGQPAVNHPGSPYLAGSTHTITVVDSSLGTVTGHYVGAIGNLTVIGLSGGGNYVELVPSGVGFQGTSNLNFAAGQLVANSYNVGLSFGGALDIILGSGGNADVILDLYAVVY